MKTIHMTLDEGLLDEVDRAAEALGTTRSGFTRDALRAALSDLRRRELECRHREGYSKNPVRPGDVSDWENEQVWPE